MDPLRSETARTADLHLRPRAGTDTLLATALMRRAMDAGLVDEDFVTERTVGFELVQLAAGQLDLEEAASRTGVPIEQLDAFVALLEKHRPALFHAGIGLQRNRRGGATVGCVAMLAAMLGVIGTPGGGVLYGSAHWRLADVTRPELNPGPRRVHNMIRLGRVLTAGSEIRALVVYGSNPAAMNPNQSLLRRGLGRADLFTVVHDQFLTDTAAHAHVVLPACSYAEQPELHTSTWHDYAQVNVQSIAPRGQSRSTFRFVVELAAALGLGDPALSVTEEEVMAEALVGTPAEGRLDFLARGPMRSAAEDETAFQDGQFPTASGRFEFMEPALPGPDAAPEPASYRLMTPKSRHLHGSQVFNLERKHRQIGEPVLHMHPADAAREDLADGEEVRVISAFGSIVLSVRLSDLAPLGVVAAYTGRWGSNVNRATTDELADLAGGSSIHSTAVRLEHG